HSGIVVPQPSPEIGVVEIKSFFPFDLNLKLGGIIPDIVHRVVPHAYFPYSLLMGIGGKTVDHLGASGGPDIFEIVDKLARKLEVVNIVPGGGDVNHAHGAGLIIG